MEQNPRGEGDASTARRRRRERGIAVDAVIMGHERQAARTEERRLQSAANAREILANRYLRKDESGNVIETRAELFARVARHVAQAERSFPSEHPVHSVQDKFFSMMSDLDFMPNSPTLMNAGLELGQLSACFVLPVDDSIDSIFRSLWYMARIHQSGGGTGFDFTHLRPKGARVSTTGGQASGPVSFMDIYDRATEVITQGGRRRGANMGILRFDHPDIMEFVRTKREESSLNNFNLSVSVSDEFMEAVRQNRSIDLKNPQTKAVAGQVRARELFDEIVEAAWRTGDPGLLFLDAINEKNPTPNLGPIEATNPCGELPLLAYESCNLASVNVGNMVRHRDIDWQKLQDRVRWGIRFLDDVVEVNNYPVEEIAHVSRGNRKIGLGVMGFADLLIKLGIPYGSRKAIYVAERLMSFIHSASRRASEELASQRGVFPNFEQSIFAHPSRPVRNATVNTIAPTGAISIIADCSSGIEPLFALHYIRNALSGTELIETNALFEEALRNENLPTERILDEVSHTGSLRDVEGVPEHLKRVFETALDIDPRQHLRIQSAFQRHTDNAVSKTVNLPKESRPEDIKQTFLAAHRMRLKGVTVYRDQSRKGQVLMVESKAEDEAKIIAEADYAGGCALGECDF